MATNVFTHQVNEQVRRNCGTMPRHWRLVRKDSEYRRRRRQIELEVQEYQRRYRAEGLRSGIVRIPAVVHVIYNNATQNICSCAI